MSDLPKIVRHRLRRTSAGPGPSRAAPAAPGNSKAVEHPDANLLSAFAEQSLTKRERALVINHLAECAECREQVSLALPEAHVETAPAAAPSPQELRARWRPWRLLRWGALAASLAAIAVVVVLHHPERGRETISSLPRAILSDRAPANKAPGGATTPTNGRTTAQAPAPASAMPRKKDMASAKEEGTSRAPLRYRAAGKMKAETEVNLPASAGLTREGAERAAEPAATAAPAALPAAPASESRNDRASRNSNSNSVVAGRAMESPKVSAAAEEKTRPAGTAGSVTTRDAARADDRESTRTQAKRAEIFRDKKPAIGPNAKPSNLSETKSSVAVAGAPPPAAAPRSRATADELERPARGAAFQQAESAARWTISSLGKLQLSLDGGRTWEEVDVGKSLRFRAVAVVGADIWAGGSRGALYHSADNGASWTRVSLTSERTQVTEDIIAVSFTDPQHGAVTTAAGERWLTVDGGQHWQTNRQ